MYNTLNVVLSDKGELNQVHVEDSRRVVEEVTNEGIVLTMNKDSFLPIAPQKINVFGWASTNPIYGGTGSGTVDTTTAVGVLAGLKQAGFETNEEISELYVDYRADRPAISINNGQEWTLPEIPAADYPAEVLARAKEFSDIAVLVISRTGGEGADLPFDMGPVMDGSTMEIGTKYMKGSYTNNSADYADYEAGQSYLELSRTERDLVELVCGEYEDVVVIYNGANTLELGWTENYEQIKGVLLCAGAGATGFNALGNILSGEVNPSGKTADTWLRDLDKAPYINNIGHFAYTNTEDVAAAAKAAWERADGIVSFVNYVEGIYVGYRFYETAAQEGLIDYEETVMYPFGYGLSYTDFRQDMGELVASGDTIRVDVTVTNTGDTAGKEVVELYYTPPYENGGIEKSNVNLVTFEKTDLLEPGQSQTLTLAFAVEDMASYDTYGTRHYVVEQGDYQISLRTDSHTVVDLKSHRVEQTIVYDESQTHNDDVAVAENRFDFAEGDVTYLSRRDGFANYAVATAAPGNFKLNGTVQGNGTYDPAEWNRADDVMPVTGAKNGLELFELRGADYEDPRWETLLDQVTVDEMVNLIAFGGHQNAAVDSVKKFRILDTDGPAGVNSSTLGAFGTGYCSEVVLAQTWNLELAEEMGMYPYIKHFALNEQEVNRNALCCTWSTEQAIREIYLKPFEDAVKSQPAGKLAVMSSYNYIGTEWAGSSSALLQDVLRNEWGFKGMVISDYFGNYGYMDADRAVRGGTDMMLGTAGNEAIMTDLSATSVIAMRQAVKNIFYTTVNSSAYENYVPGTIPTWLRMVYGIDMAIAAILVLGELLVIRSYRKKKKASGADVG